MGLADRGIPSQYEQQLDVAFGGLFALVIGGPGTGRTRCLVGRVAALLFQPGVMPEKIAYRGREARVHGVAALSAGG